MSSLSHPLLRLHSDEIWNFSLIGHWNLWRKVERSEETTKSTVENYEANKSHRNRTKRTVDVRDGFRRPTFWECHHIAAMSQQFFSAMCKSSRLGHTNSRKNENYSFTLLTTPCWSFTHINYDQLFLFCSYFPPQLPSVRLLMLFYVVSERRCELSYSNA